MAALAFDHRVRANQGKTVLVILDRLDRDRPTLLGVALLAAPAELAAMNIRMARRARCPDIAEHRADVALRAGHSLVQSAKRKACAAAVIKLRYAPNRSPTG
jgi:hypothetical protein